MDETKEGRESLAIRLLRRNFSEFEVPTPCELSENHEILALNLLLSHSQGKCARGGKLFRRHYEFMCPGIVVRSTHDGDSGGFSSDNADVLITEELFQTLVNDGLVCGKLKLGYTSDTTFLITQEGEARYWEYIQQRREEKEKEECST